LLNSLIAGALKQLNSFRFSASPPLDARGAPQEEVLNDELAFAPWKWRATMSARYLAIAYFRSIDFDHLIKRIAVRAFEGSEQRRAFRHDTS
jgi:hypothetical protein